MLVPKDLSNIFEQLGFPPLAPMPLMKLSHQVAQKLHGVTEEGSSRAHDLVDLQVQLSNGEIDLAETRGICVRLFEYRKLQSWPPTVVKGVNWDGLYAAAASELQVLPTVDEAITWANGLIARIDAAKR